MSVFLLGTYVGEHPQGKSYLLKGKFNVAVIGIIIKKECLDRAEKRAFIAGEMNQMRRNRVLMLVENIPFP